MVLIGHSLMTYDIEHCFIPCYPGVFSFMGLMQTFLPPSRKNWLIVVGEICFLTDWAKHSLNTSFESDGEGY